MRIGTGPKRSRDQRDQDLVVIAELYLKGKSQAEIAGNIGQIRDYTLSQQQISGDLRTIRKRWLESSIRDFDAQRAQELAKIDYLELTYWDSWEQSTKDSVNAPKFLAGVQWCINKRCEVLGLNAPAKVAPTDPSGRRPYVLTESERIEKLTALLGQAMERAKAEGTETDAEQP